MLKCTTTLIEQYSRGIQYTSEDNMISSKEWAILSIKSIKIRYGRGLDFTSKNWRGHWKFIRFLSNIRNFFKLIWAPVSYVLGNVAHRKVFSTQIALLHVVSVHNVLCKQAHTEIYSGKFVLKKVIMCSETWKEFDLIKHIFLYVYMLKVFGALLILHLQNLQPEEKFPRDSVTKAFWYLLIWQTILCNEFDYREVNCIN